MLEHVIMEASAENNNLNVAVYGKDHYPCLESATGSPIGSAHPSFIDQPSCPDAVAVDQTTEPDGFSTPGPVNLTIQTSETTKDNGQTTMSGCLSNHRIDYGLIDTPSEPIDPNPEDIVNVSCGSSVISDFYEPPEPKPNQDGNGCVHTPPFSSVLPDQSDPEGVVATSSSYIRSDEALTGNTQVSKVVSEPELGMLEVCCKSLRHEFPS
jgi:hypothetical protein